MTRSPNDPIPSGVDGDEGRKERREEKTRQGLGGGMDQIRMPLGT